jgi:hypothetical protein
MGLNLELNNTKVFLDTAPLIYYIEDNQHYSQILGKLFLKTAKKVPFFNISNYLT